MLPAPLTHLIDVQLMAADVQRVREVGHETAIVIVVEVPVLEPPSEEVALACTGQRPNVERTRVTARVRARARARARVIHRTQALHDVVRALSCFTVHMLFHNI